MSMFSPRPTFTDELISDTALVRLLQLDPVSVANRASVYTIAPDGSRSFWLSDVAHAIREKPHQLKARLRRAELTALAASGAAR